MLGDWARRGVEVRAFDVASGRSGCRGSAAISRAPSALAVDGRHAVRRRRGGVSAWDLRDGTRLPYAGAVVGGRPGGRRRRASRSGAVGQAMLGGRSRAARWRRSICAPGRCCRSTRRSTAACMEQFPNYIGPWLRTLEKVGDTVYLGGAFATVGGHPQTHLAAVDAVTGAWRPGFPSVRGGAVNALAVSGTTLYVGGEFNQLGEQAGDAAGRGRSRDRAGARLGAVRSGCNVNAMEVVARQALRRGVRPAGLSTRRRGRRCRRRRRPAGSVYAIEPDGLGGVWVGGSFTKFAGASTAYLGHIDFNGLAVGYRDRQRAGGRDRGVAGRSCYLSGGFGRLAGEARWGLGSVDLSTGPRDVLPAGAVAEPGDDGGAAATAALLIGGEFDVPVRWRRSATWRGSGRAARPVRRPRAATRRPSSATSYTGGVRAGLRRGLHGLAGGDRRCAGCAAPPTCAATGRDGWVVHVERRGRRLPHAGRSSSPSNDAGDPAPRAELAGPGRAGPAAVRDLPGVRRTRTASSASATRSRSTPACGSRAPTSFRYVWRRCTSRRLRAADRRALAADLHGDRRRRRLRTSASRSSRSTPRARRRTPAAATIGPIAGRPARPATVASLRPVRRPYGEQGRRLPLRHAPTPAARTPPAASAGCAATPPAARATRLSTTRCRPTACVRRRGPHVPPGRSSIYSPGGVSASAPPTRARSSPRPARRPTPTPTRTPSPSPSPVPTPPANSYATGTATPRPAPSPTPSPTPPSPSSPSPAPSLARAAHRPRPPPSPAHRRRPRRARAVASPRPSPAPSPSPSHRRRRLAGAAPPSPEPLGARPATLRPRPPPARSRCPRRSRRRCRARPRAVALTLSRTAAGAAALRPRAHGHRPAARRAHAQGPRSRDGQAPRRASRTVRLKRGAARCSPRSPGPAAARPARA